MRYAKEKKKEVQLLIKIHDEGAPDTRGEPEIIYYPFADQETHPRKRLRGLSEKIPPVCETEPRDQKKHT